MTPIEIRAAFTRLYGESYRAQAAEAFGVELTTIDRWITEEGRPNHRAIHPSAEKLLVLLLELKAKRERQLGYEAKSKKRARLIKRMTRQSPPKESD